MPIENKYLLLLTQKGSEVRHVRLAQQQNTTISIQHIFVLTEMYL